MSSRGRRTPTASVRATDGTNSSVLSQVATATAVAPTADYSASVRSDTPAIYWQGNTTGSWPAGTGARRDDERQPPAGRARERRGELGRHPRRRRPQRITRLRRRRRATSGTRDSLRRRRPTASRRGSGRRPREAARSSDSEAVARRADSGATVLGEQLRPAPLHDQYGAGRLRRLHPARPRRPDLAQRAERRVVAPHRGHAGRQRDGTVRRRGPRGAEFERGRPAVLRGVARRRETTSPAGRRPARRATSSRARSTRPRSIPSALGAGDVADSHYEAAGRELDLNHAPADDEYGTRVFAADPTLYWRLGEASGTTAGRCRTLRHLPRGLPDRRRAGAAGRHPRRRRCDDPRHAARAPSPPRPRSRPRRPSPARSGSTRRPPAASSSSDSRTHRPATARTTTSTCRTTAGGNLVFGSWVGSAAVVTSPLGYADGEWHSAVGDLRFLRPEALRRRRARRSEQRHRRGYDKRVLADRRRQPPAAGPARPPTPTPAGRWTSSPCTTAA